MSTIKIPSYYYLRRIHALCLLVPMGFYGFFALILAGLALGPDGFKNFNTALRVFSHFPLLFLFEILFLYGPLLFYFLYGLARLTERETHLFNPLSAANTLYFFQGVTLFLSFAFLAYHFYATRFLAYLTQTSLDYLWMVRLFENPLHVLAYNVGVFSLLFHYGYSLRQAMIDSGCKNARSNFVLRALVFLLLLMLVIFLLAILNFVYHYNDPPAFLGPVIHFVRDVLSR
ncbi:hypothetical protein K1X76_11020 [bacterium]|nr:hypothetical protein [bacterium]